MDSDLHFTISPVEESKRSALAIGMCLQIRPGIASHSDGAANPRCGMDHPGSSIKRRATTVAVGPRASSPAPRQVVGFDLDERRLGVSHAEDFLAHFGVKGMKWGVRRSPKLAKEGPSKDAQASLDL